MTHAISPEIAKTIKQIEITTRRMLNGSLVGDSRSALKGTGLEFDQIRDYQQGDDVRFVDWRATARADKLLVKQYIEERNRTVVLAVDCSASSFYGSGVHKRYERIAEIASVLALAAEYGKDQTALLLFTDEVELFIPAGKGRMHIKTIMEKLFTYTPKRTKTSINAVLEHTLHMKRSDTIFFLLSDFIDESYDTLLSVLAQRFDTVAIHCCDKRETAFPACGLLVMQDVETGKEVLFDTRRQGASRLSTFLSERDESVKRLFKKLRIDSLHVATDEECWRSLIIFLRRRMTY